jgi:hypothetical protein
MARVSSRIACCPLVTEYRLHMSGHASPKIAWVRPVLSIGAPVLLREMVYLDESAIEHLSQYPETPVVGLVAQRLDLQIKTAQWSWPDEGNRGEELTSHCSTTTTEFAPQQHATVIAHKRHALTLE